MFLRLALILLATLVALPAMAGTTVTKALDAKTTTGASSWVPTQDNGKTAPGTVGAVQVTLVATGATSSSVTYQTSPDASTATVAYTFTDIGATPVTIQCSPSPYGRLNYATGTGTITGHIVTMAAPNETGGCHLLGTAGTGTINGSTGTGALVLATSPTLVTPTLGVASATSLATSAATPLILTQGQAVNVTLTSQSVGATTLTIPDFASVVDEFTFKTKSQTMSNKTFVAPVLGAATGTSVALSADATARHFLGTGTSPTVTGASSTCGTTAAAIAGKDTGGTVTVGSVGGTVCVVTFGTAFANAPACVVSRAVAAGDLAVTTSTTALTATATFGAGELFNYVCVAY